MNRAMKVLAIAALLLTVAGACVVLEHACAAGGADDGEPGSGFRRAGGV